MLLRGVKMNPGATAPRPLAVKATAVTKKQLEPKKKEVVKTPAEIEAAFEKQLKRTSSFDFAQLAEVIKTQEAAARERKMAERKAAASTTHVPVGAKQQDEVVNKRITPLDRISNMKRSRRFTRGRYFATSRAF